MVKINTNWNHVGIAGVIEESAYISIEIGIDAVLEIIFIEKELSLIQEVQVS